VFLISCYTRCIVESSHGDDVAHIIRYCHVPSPAPQLCPYESGLTVLSRFNIPVRTPAGEDVLWVCVGVLVVLCIFYRALALVMLYRLSWGVKDAVK
jgi:hypothetical protein